MDGKLIVSKILRYMNNNNCSGRWDVLSSLYILHKKLPIIVKHHRIFSNCRNLDPL